MSEIKTRKKYYNMIRGRAEGVKRTGDGQPQEI